MEAFVNHSSILRSSMYESTDPGKIVIYNKSFFNVSETFVYHQVKFAQSRYKLSLLGHQKKSNETFPLKGVDITCINEEEPVHLELFRKVMRRLGVPVTMGLQNSKKVEEFLLREKPDLIHAHFGYNAVNILPVVRKLNIPMIVTFHGYDASPMIHSKPAYYKLLPELLEYCKKIIIVSNHMRFVLPLTAEQQKKLVIYPCPVDADYFSPLDMKSKPGEIGILHSGRLVPKKGVTDLARVFHEVVKTHPQTRLDLIGEGPELQKINLLCNELNISDKVHIHGQQPQSVVRDFIGGTDIFVLNSRTAENGDMEGSPVTILEAMSMGKAVISTKHAGIPDLIENEKNGLLVDEKDNEGLLNAINRLIEEPRLRYKLGQNARQSVEENFSINVNRDKLLRIYHSVMHNRLETVSA